MTKLSLSELQKTWLLDLDGVVFRHNGYLQGDDEILPGVKAFWGRIPPDDAIVLLTARAEEYRAQTLSALTKAGLRYDHAIFGLPVGERICINDVKPSGLLTCYAVNLPRDGGLGEVAFTFGSPS